MRDISDGMQFGHLTAYKLNWLDGILKNSRPLVLRIQIAQSEFLETNGVVKHTSVSRPVAGVTGEIILQLMF